GRLHLGHRPAARGAGDTPPPRPLRAHRGRRARRAVVRGRYLPRPLAGRAARRGRAHRLALPRGRPLVHGAVPLPRAGGRAQPARRRPLSLRDAGGLRLGARHRPVHGRGAGGRARRRDRAAEGHGAPRRRLSGAARAAHRARRPPLNLESPPPARYAGGLVPEGQGRRIMRSVVILTTFVATLAGPLGSRAANFDEDTFERKSIPAYSIPTPARGGQPAESVIGQVRPYRIRKGDTLIDLARYYDLGYNEIVDANPAIDPWVPPAGATILLPTQWVLPCCT